MAYSDTMGSLGRVMRPAVREFEQQEKDRQRRAMEKSNAQDLDELESYIRQITSLHHEIIEKIDWEAQSRPEAKQVYAQLRAGDDSTLMRVIKSQQKLSAIHKLGRGLGFTVEKGQVHAVLALHKQSIVPDFEFKHMPSGKLVETKMPKETAFRIYRAHASSAMLKVASDLFRLVPTKNIVVTAIAPCSVPDSKYDEDWPVYSVNFLRKHVLQMDMAQVDPVVSVRAFQHVERFQPSQGFGRIIPLMSIPARMAI